MQTTLVSISIPQINHYEVISLDSSNNWRYVKDIMQDISVPLDVSDPGSKFRSGQLKVKSCITAGFGQQCCHHTRRRWWNKCSELGTCESFFLRSNRISNRIGRPIRFRIEFSNPIGRIYHASRNTVWRTAGCLCPVCCSNRANLLFVWLLLITQ